MKSINEAVDDATAFTMGKEAAHAWATKLDRAGQDKDADSSYFAKRDAFIASELPDHLQGPFSEGWAFVVG